ncbi:MAG: hypothetical protein ACREBU_11430 [Nitrososphaera sp.]
MPKKEDEEKDTDTTDKDAGKKLLAGKFKTQEELEAAYAESERTMHSKSEEAARAKEEAAQWRAEVESMKPKRNEDHTADAEEDPEAFREQFIANPREALITFGKGLASGILKEVETRNASRDKVSRFLNDNPEIRASANLFAVSLAQVPGNLSIDDKLKKAADLTRSEINRIKEEAKKTQDSEDESHRRARIEDESGGRDTPRKKSKKDEDDEDHSFGGYMKERNEAFGAVKGIV